MNYNNPIEKMQIQVYAKLNQQDQQQLEMEELINFNCCCCLSEAETLMLALARDKHIQLNYRRKYGYYDINNTYKKFNIKNIKDNLICQNQLFSRTFKKITAKKPFPYASNLGKDIILNDLKLMKSIVQKIAPEYEKYYNDTLNIFSGKEICQAHFDEIEEVDSSSPKIRMEDVMNGGLAVGAITHKKGKKIEKAIKERKKYEIKAHLYENFEDNEEFQWMEKEDYK